MKTEDKILSALKAVVLLSEAQIDIQLGKHGEAFDKVRQAKIEILHAVYLLEVDPLQVTFSEWLNTAIKPIDQSDFAQQTYFQVLRSEAELEDMLNDAELMSHLQKVALSKQDKEQEED